MNRNQLKAQLAAILSHGKVKTQPGDLDELADVIMADPDCLKVISQVQSKGLQALLGAVIKERQGNR